MNKYIRRYSFGYVRALLYMLQASGYNISQYLTWFSRTTDFKAVEHRSRLEWSLKIKLLAIMMIGSMVMTGIIAMSLLVRHATVWDLVGGVALILLMPHVVAYLIVVPLWIGERLIQKPREKRIITNAALARQKLTGTVIAIAGSYGKTTFKESLKTVLSESKTVVATPGNKNTLLGTSHFLSSLRGDEDIVICELGESHVGDVRELCELVKPDMGVITGINEAHLETFGTIENTVNTIFELQDYLGDKPLYKNIESRLVNKKVVPGDSFGYSAKGVHGWKVTDIDTSLHGTKCTATRKNETVRVSSKLIGEHQVGPLVACIDIADGLGLSAAQIAEGIKKTSPFAHRMQPYQLRGAMIIDDTYNGNIDGVLSGLALLKKEKGRRIYVTPGLVEQGEATVELHEKIGLAAADSADIVVLMKNSVTEFIEAGLKKAKFGGEVLITDNPLRFYENLDQFVAHGDVVLMQNDWTDNYH